MPLLQSQCSSSLDMNCPLLGGVIHCRELDGWDIRWEADGTYRHWCSQVRRDNFNGRFIAVCLFNPGSLSGDGTNLRRDTTLRILRDVFSSTAYGCIVLNLFDRATPKPSELFSTWSERDKANSRLIYDLVSNLIVASIPAYGDYENHPDPTKAHEIRSRITVLKTWRAGFASIESPRNDNGTPMHVMRWQIKGLKKTLAQRLSDFSPS